MVAVNNPPNEVRPYSRHKPDGKVLMAKNQVTALLGVGDTRLWEWLRDDLFPKPIEIGPPGGRSSMIAWYRSEVEEWLATRPRRQFGQHEFRGKRKAEVEATPANTVTRDVLSATTAALAASRPPPTPPKPKPESTLKLTGARTRPSQRAAR